MANKLRQDLKLLWRGLLLETTAYDEAGDDDRPFVDGFFLVVLVGVILGLAALLGSLFDWATTPNLGQIKDIIFDALRAMPWFDAISSNPQAVEEFTRQYNLGWRISDWFAPSISTALGTLITTPIGLLIGWLWFGLVAHGVARLLGGKAAARQTLGAAALASAPALLGVVGILPGLAVAGVGILTLLARYTAIRRVHLELSWGRALTATLAPTLILWLFVGALGLILIPIAIAAIGGMIQ
ncbi:MAG: YIP1 family protein [Caldilineales bacterium]|nr:YIP1 family protein [Caldilineales bacterium]MCW5859696.1 YIP1 family protein [Caldilineales bacterium]